MTGRAMPRAGPAAGAALARTACLRE